MNREVLPRVGPTIRSLLLCLTLTVLTVLSAWPRHALAGEGQRNRNPPPPANGASAGSGRELTISVVTMGPGDHPFLKFGHNAIWIQDRRTHTSRLYNFGTFSFRSPTLIADFLQGRLHYWLSVQSPRALDDYRSANRSLVVQELEFTDAEARALSQSLAENALPQNREYKYDYYLDNCATRVRDAIDKAVAGRLHAVTRGPATMTFRDHTLRLVADDIPLYVALDLALGRAADRPISEWDEMFLPSKIQESLRAARVPGSSAEVPLVQSEKTLFAARREPLRAAPPNRVPWASALGLLAGLSFYFTGRSARRSARVGFGLALSFVGLVAGFLGMVFVFFWAFTDHEIAHKNENILQCAPFALLLVLSGIASAFGSSKRAPTLNLWLTSGAAALSLLGILLKVLPGFFQDNGLVFAFMFPLWLGAALGSRSRNQRRILRAGGARAS